ncbi:MAG: hypothetical protein KTR28_09450 [Micavibrio sp.]|nr:hypothetical protein [Micavibrio sp.]
MDKVKDGYNEILAAFDLGADSLFINTIDLTAHFETKGTPSTLPKVLFGASSDSNQTLEM